MGSHYIDRTYLFAFASDIHGVPVLLMSFRNYIRILKGYRLLHADTTAK